MLSLGPYNVLRAVATRTVDGIDDWLLHIRQPDGRVLKQSQLEVCEDHAPSWLRRFWDEVFLEKHGYEPGDMVSRREISLAADTQLDELDLSDNETGFSSRAPTIDVPLPSRKREPKLSKRKRSVTPSKDDSEGDYPILQKQRRNPREVRAENRRRHEYQGHHVLLAAEAVPALPTNEDGLPILPREPQPISVKARLALSPNDVLESISPGVTPRHHSSTTPHHRSSVLTHNKEAGGLVELRISRQGTSSIRELSRIQSAAPESIRAAEPAPELEYFEERAQTIEYEWPDEALPANVAIVAPQTIAAADDLDDLPDYEEVVEEAEDKNPPEAAPVLEHRPIPEQEPNQARARFTIPGRPEPDTPIVGIRPGIDLAVSMGALRRYRVDLKFPPCIMGKLLNRPNIHPADTPVFPIELKDFSNTSDPSLNLNLILKSVHSMELSDGNVRSRPQLTETEREGWKRGAGMCARVRIVDSQELDDKYDMFQDIVQQLKNDEQYLSFSTSVTRTRLLLFPAEDEELCELLQVRSAARGLPKVLLISRITLPGGQMA